MPYSWLGGFVKPMHHNTTNTTVTGDCCKSKIDSQEWNDFKNLNVIVWGDRVTSLLFLLSTNYNNLNLSQADYNYFQLIVRKLQLRMTHWEAWWAIFHDRKDQMVGEGRSAAYWEQWCHWFLECLWKEVITLCCKDCDIKTAVQTDMFSLSSKQHLWEDDVRGSQAHEAKSLIKIHKDHIKICLQGNRIVSDWGQLGIIFPLPWETWDYSHLY